MKFFTYFTLTVVLLCGALVAYTTFKPRVGGQQFSELPPQTQKQRRIEAQQLIERVEAIARSSKTPGAKKPFVIKASESQLNTLLQDRLRTQKFPISNLSVGLTPGILTLQGTAQYGGVDLPATISGTLKARDGALDYQLESLSVSGMPAPSNLREKAQKAIQDGLQKAFASQNRARIESVEIAPGEMTLRGQSG